MTRPPPLSVASAFAGRELLITGVTGFVAKVLVAEILYKLPQIQRVHLLIRANADQNAEDRFLRIAATSPAFRPLRERFGDDLGAFLGARVEVHEGDVSEPLFGLGEHVIRQLAPRLDAILHVAGLTDFAPDPRQALEVNIDGAIHAADLAARCERAVLVHTSTCFVAGTRQGRIPEEVSRTAPSGAPWDPESELIHLQTLACHEAASSDRDAQREAKAVRIAAATARAELLGFTNIYTYTKGLAEALLTGRVQASANRRAVPLTIIRPAIVECAEAFPFQGWNEGINTTGPLLWLCKSFFRHFPSKDDNHFDLIPVDAVTGSTIAITAAALEGRAAPVYHIGTSGSNPHTMGRGFELANLAIRKGMADSDNKIERFIQRFFDNVTVSAEVEHAFSPSRLRRFARTLKNALAAPRLDDVLPAPLARPLGRPLTRLQTQATQALSQADRQLGRVQRLFDIYRPFIHDNDWIFINDAVHALDTELDTDSLVQFGFRGDRIDWRHYWLDTLYPGLNTWCMPLLEGKEIPEDPPMTLVLLPPLPEDPGDGVVLLEADDAELSPGGQPEPHLTPDTLSPSKPLEAAP